MHQNRRDKCSRLPGAPYVLHGDVYDDNKNFEFPSKQLNVSFGANKKVNINKKESISTASTQSTNEIKFKKDKNKSVAVQNKLSTEEFDDDEEDDDDGNIYGNLKGNGISENPEDYLCDMIDDTNTDILAFLSEMYAYDECDPDINDLFEDSISYYNKDGDNVCERTKKKCCCDCHSKDDDYGGDCSVNKIRAPAGTNITIPIYAAAAVPQSPANNIIWPPLNSRCPSNPSRCLKHPNGRSVLPASFPQFQPPTSRPTHRCPKRLPVNFSNHNNANNNWKTNQSDDTLDFQSQFQNEEFGLRKERGSEKNFYESLSGNRMDRVGSPMNWDEIMRFLD